MRQIPGDPPEVLERFHANLELVEIVTGRLLRSLHWPVPREDLVSAGHEGLLDAARRYDASRGATFRTFAYYRISGALFDEVRRQAPLPHHSYKRLKATEAVTHFGEGDAGFEPSAPGLSEAGEEESLDDHILGAALGIRLQLEDENTKAPETSATHPEIAYERAELLSLVRQALDEIDTAEADVIRRYYFEERNLEDIASEFGLSKSWVSRLHTRTIARLARRLRSAAGNSADFTKGPRAR